MDWLSDLIEGIFSNFYIVILIVAGIVGFFKSESEKKKQQQRKSQNHPRPTATPSGAYRQKQPERSRASRAEQQAVTMKTVEEQQKEQMKQLASRYHTDTKQAIEKLPDKATIGNSLREPKTQTSQVGKGKFKKQMKNNLGRKGLMNSVLMAEVLGSPRAKKPYQSIIDQRRK